MGQLLSAPKPTSSIAGTVVGSPTATAGSQKIDLDIVALNDSLAIALLMTIDEKIPVFTKAGKGLAAALKQQAGCTIEVVVSAATLGIPVGQAVATALSHERQVVLQKTAKIHLQNTPYAEPLSSITTGTPQKLLLDPRHIDRVRGKKVAFVDDVISSGGSCAAALRLIRDAGGIVVGVGAILVEGSGWKEKIGAEDAKLVSFLGTIPLYRPPADAGGAWVADWEC